LALWALAACLGSAPSLAAEGADIWTLLRSGNHVALIRHAEAPGTGDPPNFTLGECNTQRNLSKEGRDQAKRIGAFFRDNGIWTARVLTSEWCRCRDTAENLELGLVEELPLLNSFFGRMELGARQTRALKSWLGEQAGDPPIILVTHQVNITALAGVYPGPGEIVVVRIGESGAVAVVGTIPTQ
jgi:broad specificity phosphatase PhoE